MKSGWIWICRVGTEPNHAFNLREKKLFNVFKKYNGEILYSNLLKFPIIDHRSI